MDINIYLERSPPGERSRLAKELGIDRPLISQWFTGVRRIPADRVVPLARATNWLVTPHELRPDIYPNPTDALPPERLDGAA